MSCAISPAVEADYEGPLMTARHRCRRCYEWFLYHYDSQYAEDQLVEIDYICLACLADYMAEWDRSRVGGRIARVNTR